MISGSRLAKTLNEGRFAVTAEFVPPASGSQTVLKESISVFTGIVDAVQVSDNMGARVSTASLAASKILLDSGIEPIMTLVTRDRNRIALQSDLLGASALGICNVFCTTGDHQKFGDNPGALNVYDIDSVQLVAAARRLSDEGRLISGAACDIPAPLFIGATASFRSPIDLMVIRHAQKVEAGANFIQTGPVFDVEELKMWMGETEKEGLAGKCFVLATVMPLKSAHAALTLKQNARGFDIPGTIIERLQARPENDQTDEGLKICCEQIQAIRDLKGVSGIHIMAPGWEGSISEILKEAGLSVSRTVSSAQ